jgi:hypothetical protein
MKVGSLALYVVGGAFILLGVSHWIYDHIQRVRLSLPPEHALLRSNVAILGVGVVAVLAAEAIRNLERRLNQMEHVRKKSDL